MKSLVFISKENKVKKINKVDINYFLLKKLSQFIPKINSKDFSGFSPPEVFVGRIGYPKVFAGPVVTKFNNPEDLLYTEKWFGKNLDEIFALRMQAIRGKSLIRINDVNNKIVEKLQEGILSKNFVSTEVRFKKIVPNFKLSFDHQPYGPSAVIEDFKINPSSTDFKIEKVFYDKDLKAKEAVFNLYLNGVPVSKIQQAFSIGMIGVKRKLVPTRWSITAVDDIIGRSFLEKVKDYETIDVYRVYYTEYLNNKWIILMFPSFWQYESIEAWYPGTIDNYFGIGGDYEIYEFKKDYASIGGCWYAARAMIAEHLYKEKRQAGVLVLREIHKGYIPVGVWNVRETVRNMLNGKFEKFDNLDSALNYINLRLTIPLRVWLFYSKILKDLKSQKKIKDFGTESKLR